MTRLIEIMIAVGIGAALLSEAAPLGKIELGEYVGAMHAAQVLHYRLELARGALTDVSRCTLRSEDGVFVLAQCTARGNWDDGSARFLEVAFVSGLEPWERKVFTLDDSGAAPADDGALTVSHGGGFITLGSPAVGVRVPVLEGTLPAAGRPAEQVPPPVAQIRGDKGWYGRGALRCDIAVTAREVKVTDDGPIYKRAAVEYTFAGGQKYIVQVTVSRDEPLVRVKESFSLPFSRPTHAEFVFDFAPGLSPDMCVEPPVHGPGPSLYGTGSLWDLRTYRGDMFPLSFERDVNWFELAPCGYVPGEGPHVAFFSSAAREMAGIITTAPEEWHHVAYDMLPGDSWKLVQNPHMFFTLRRIKNVPIEVGRDRSVKARFPLNTGRREWAFFVSGDFPLTEEVEEGKGDDKKTTVYNSAPRSYFNVVSRRFCRNSLDRRKDEVLRWDPDPGVAYPRLYADGERFEPLRQAYNEWFGSERIPPLDEPTLRGKMKGILLSTIDATTSRMLDNPGPPHHITVSIYQSVNLADMLLGTGVLTTEEEERVRAGLAYMAYMLSWPGYWSPENANAANPNMSTFCYDALGLIGLLLADHPESGNWVGKCTTQIDREMEHWITAGGAWIENTHYVLASWHQHSMLMTALKHNGLRDYYRHPMVRKFFEYYFDMQTPPDPDVGGQRVCVQVGNAYPYLTIYEFGVWARGMRDVDPEFASNLMWMWHQHGYGNAAQRAGKRYWRGGAGLDHWFGQVSGLPPYWEMLFFDPGVEPIAPATRRGGSYPEFGCVLQSHFGSDRETKLYLREGQTYSHYDMDQGSIILYGKGAPLVLDHGYGEFHPWLHNRISVNHMWDDSLGHITSFFAGMHGGLAGGEVTIDTLTVREYPGVKQWPTKPEPIDGRATATPWSRRVLFLGDTDPLGPNYFVMRDTVRGELPTEWTLWAYGTVDDFAARPLRVTGKHGVDLLLYLLDEDIGEVRSADVEFKNELGNRDTQLIHAARPAGRGVLSVLYPLLPDDAAPAVSRLPGDVGMKLEVAGRTDWVFVPESRTAAEVDGIAFEGTAAAYSRRGETGYILLDGGTKLTVRGLSVASSLPVEMTVHADRIEGHAAGEHAGPVVRLGGETAARAATLSLGAEPVAVESVDGQVVLRLPVGETDFVVSLR